MVTHNERFILMARWMIAFRLDNQRVMREIESEIAKRYSYRTFRKSMRALDKYALNWKVYQEAVA